MDTQFRNSDRFLFTGSSNTPARDREEQHQDDRYDDGLVHSHDWASSTNERS